MTEPSEKPQRKRRLRRLFGDNLFITLLGTTVGVLLGLYLNNMNARKDTRNRKAIALDNLKKELAANYKEIAYQEEDNEVIQFFGAVYGINGSVSEVIESSPEVMTNLVHQYPKMIAISDSTASEGDRYKYNVEYLFSVNLDEIQDMAWETVRISNIIQEFNYECLQDLVRVYQLQEILSNEQQKVIDYILNRDYNKLHNILHLLKQLKVEILEAMKTAEEALEVCG